jgi:hypothetical protein
MAMSLIPKTILIGCVLTFSLNLAQAATVGEILKPIELADAHGEPAEIPDFGEKVLIIFYNDADRADLNDPLADAIKAEGFDPELQRGIGIANLKDSKAPNFMIRSVIRGKIKKYKSTILTDPDLRLPTAWDMGDCNNDSIVMLVGTDGKLERIQRGGVRGADIATWLKHIQDLLTPELAQANESAATARVLAEKSSADAETVQAAESAGTGDSPTDE